jgi:hypothetical protein
MIMDRRAALDVLVRQVVSRTVGPQSEQYCKAILCSVLFGIQTDTIGTETNFAGIILLQQGLR